MSLGLLLKAGIYLKPAIKYISYHRLKKHKYVSILKNPVITVKLII